MSASSVTPPPERFEADYDIETSVDPCDATDAMAGDQSSGTFVKIPGAALCEADFDDPDLSGFEAALKGGQMGSTDYFIQVEHGSRAEH